MTIRYRGASGSGNDIIMILVFMAGLAIVFYYLAKMEVENAAKGAADAVGGAIGGAIDVVTGAAGGAANVVGGAAVDVGTAVSQVVSLPTLTANNVTGTLAEDIVDIFTPIGYPTHKFFKDGKWYILYGCDSNGYNCTSSREPLFPYEGQYLPEAK